MSTQVYLMAATTGIIAFVVLIVAVILLWYFTEGLRLPTSPITSSVSATTTSSGHVTGTTTSATTSIVYTQNCAALTIFTGADNTTNVNDCSWTGGQLGIWVGGGNTGSEHMTIVGADNVTYLNQSSTYQCVEFWKNVTLPSQTYKVTLVSGPGTLNKSSSCTYAMGIINTTLTPPMHVVYNNFVYNGNFSSGTYAGWNITGKGFGSGPLNITFANGNLNVTPKNVLINNTYSSTANSAAGCYVGSKWSGYIGSYIATTYMCGTQVSPGNLTSSPFFSSKPFLNFKIISPQNQFLYVEVLYNGTPAIVAHYDTYNTSLGANASSTFRNASIPLVTVINKPVQIKVVADTQLPQNFIAVGDFSMANIPSQTKGILTNITFSNP